MNARHVGVVGWSAFLAACVLELIVFGLFDPVELHWRGNPLELPRIAVYSIGFALFWLAAAAASYLTVVLLQPPEVVNRGE